MPKQWNCAVVGCGTVGQTHVRVIPHLPNARLVAVCDVNPERATGALLKANQPGVPMYQEMSEMLAREEIDVVHLATPSGMHCQGTMLAMEHGKHVICEKPIEIQLDLIDQMIATSAKTGMRLATIYQNRYADANRAIKSAVAEGRFGKLAWAGVFTPWYRPDKYYTDTNWRGTWKLDGGGAIMNQSVHSVDLLQWIVGPVKSVSAYASSRIHPTIEAEDTCSCSLEFENGAYGTIMGSTGMYPGLPARLEIGGEHGCAVQENGLKFFKFRQEHPEDAELLASLAPNPAVSPGVAANAAATGNDLHTRNLSAIFSAWDDGRDAETDAPESRKAVAIIQAIYESVRAGGAAVGVK